MKYFYFLGFACAMFFCSATHGQSVDNAFATAKKENKLVMIVVESKTCAQCNEVADQGLSSEVTKRALNASAIIVKVPEVPEQLAGAFSVFSFSSDFFGTIYADADKNVLYVYHGSSSFFKTYIDYLETALKEKEGGGTTLTQLINNYYGKKGGFETNMKLIEKILQVGLEPKDEIINDLVQKAPADSASSLSFLQFVEKAAPSMNSTAHLYTTKNLDNYNMSWYRMDNRERSEINNRMYRKSMQKAISTKDISYMFQVSSIRQRMYQSSPPQVIQRVSMETPLEYYKEVKDTNMYLNTAGRYYEMFFMTVNVDSVKRIDSSRQSGLMRSASSNMPKIPGLTSVIVGQPIALSPLANYYSARLNEGAWNSYLFTKNPLYLGRALLWSKRSIEFMETPENMDTYARLLYVTNNKTTALEWEARAIEVRKTRHQPVTAYEKALDSMKKGNALD